jgi:hypothetical protein
MDCRAAVSGQQFGKQVLAGMETYAKIEERCFQCGQSREVITRTAGATSSGSFVREVLKIGPERVKLKNFHCYKPLPGNGW